MVDCQGKQVLILGGEQVLCITSDSKLKILATSRNIVSTGVTKLNTNYWETE